MYLLSEMSTEKSTEFSNELKKKKTHKTPTITKPSNQSKQLLIMAFFFGGAEGSGNREGGEGNRKRLTKSTICYEIDITLNFTSLGACKTGKLEA